MIHRVSSLPSEKSVFSKYCWHCLVVWLGTCPSFFFFLAKSRPSSMRGYKLMELMLICSRQPRLHAQAACRDTRTTNTRVAEQDFPPLRYNLLGRWQCGTEWLKIRVWQQRGKPKRWGLKKTFNNCITQEPSTNIHPHHVSTDGVRENKQTASHQSDTALAGRCCNYKS